MITTTNRIAAYKRKTAEIYADDQMEFHQRYMAGIAIQRRVTQGNRKLKLISNIKTPVENRQRNVK